MAIWDYEINRTRVMHEVWQAYYRANERVDIMILLVIIMVQIMIIPSLILNCQNGVIWLISLNIVTTALNVGNAIMTIKRMIERRKDMREELELYDDAMQELLELHDFEEDGWEVELE